MIDSDVSRGYRGNVSEPRRWQDPYTFRIVKSGKGWVSVRCLRRK